MFHVKQERRKNSYEQFIIVYISYYYIYYLFYKNIFREIIWRPIFIIYAHI